MPEDTLVDFAVVAFREDGLWQVGSLPHRAAEHLSSLTAAVRQLPSEGAALALCSYGDDFFLALRHDGLRIRMVVSDAGAAEDWPIAAEALEQLGETPPDDDLVVPAGDLDLFADFGMTALELTAICSDLELYPDEMLRAIAFRVGFGPQFAQAVDDDLV